MSEATIPCPKCQNLDFEKHDYACYKVNGGIVRGWKLKCLKCDTSYIIDEYAYEDLKNKKLKDIDSYAREFAKLLLEENN